VEGEGTASWPGHLQGCCPRHVCFRCAERNRRAAGSDDGSDSVGASAPQGEDLETTRHMGERTNFPPENARRLQTTVDRTPEQ